MQEATPNPAPTGKAVTEETTRSNRVEEPGHDDTGGGAAMASQITPFALLLILLLFRWTISYY